jgi:Leucine-rich repeat (LRR) protein
MFLNSLFIFYKRLKPFNMYYKLINDDTKYDINNIKELNNLNNKQFVIELDISNNQLTQLPEFINEFINLQTLNCSFNKLTTLGELNLPNLQILDCGNNKLTTLGELNFPNLQELSCSSNKLTTLGELNFPNLQELYCNYNQLTTLGELNLPNLQLLYCYYNKLTTLGELNLPNLQELYCYNNKLITLVELNLSNLQKLNCYNNQLTTLGELNFPNLQILNCSNNKLTILGELNLPNLQQLYCHYNKLTTLGELNLPNLQELYCYNNKLTTLGELNLSNLQILSCTHNQLTTLGTLKLPNLQNLYCSSNKLTILGQLNLSNLQILSCKHNQLTTLGTLKLPNLQNLYCYNNELTTLGELNLPNLQILSCTHNQLTTLGELNLPNLLELNCSDNKLTTLPLWLMNIRLNYIDYDNNEIDNLPIQLIRFINRIQQGNINELNVYNDGQNIHNSSIQLTVRDSINRLSDKFREPFNLELLTNQILEDPIINCKERLIQYMSNKEEHSLLLLNFAEILWLVWMEINTFNEETQIEIKKRLNEEIQEAECMCYTGRCNRLINCLNGFSDLVEIKIQDSSQIGNVIVIVKNRLEDNNEYTINKHKEEVKKELLERGYELKTINEWIEYIQEE